MGSSGKPKGKMSGLEGYVDFIKKRTGVKWGESMSVADFDNAHEPIGNVIRFDLRKDGLIHEADGQIYLTNKAKQNR